MTIDAVARRFGIDVTELEDYCASGYIKCLEIRGHKVIPEYEEQKLAVISKLPHLKNKILILQEGFMHDYHPELAEYLCFHGILDMFCWLIKLRYSPREAVKKKAYTLPS